MDKIGVTLEESLANVIQQRDFWISQLPNGLTKEEQPGFHNRLVELYDRFEKNVRAIYKRGMSLGKDFSGLLYPAEDEDYSFYLDGVARYFKDGAVQVDLANEVASAKTNEERLFFEYQAILATKIFRE